MAASPKNHEYPVRYYICYWKLLASEPSASDIKQMLKPTALGSF
nr:hypothetical protein [Escherichia coli]UWM21769.1 hypothetical protein [Escherichia coli]